MAKKFRRRIPIVKRSASLGNMFRQTERPPVMSLKKCASSGPQSCKLKKRKLQKILRTKAEVDTEEFLNVIEPFRNTSKRISNQNDSHDAIERNELDESARSNNKFLELTPKSSSRKRHKANAISTLRNLDFKSQRNKLKARCFEENEVMRIDPSMQGMLRKCIKDEDCDSDDEIIATNTKRGLNFLKDGLETYQTKRVLRSPSRKLEQDISRRQTPERTRRNSLLK